MRGEFFSFLVALDLSLPCIVPDYCLVSIVGISALFSILPGPDWTSKDPGLLDPEGGPPTYSPCYSVDLPAYGPNIRLVKCIILYSFCRVVHRPWVGRLRNYGGRARSTTSSSNLWRGRLMNGEQGQRLVPPRIPLLRLYTEPPCAVGKLHQHGRSLTTTPPVPRMTRFLQLIMPNWRTGAKKYTPSH